ncbi:MAG: MBL fold metallo-hydrolase [Prevotella sp.]|nr:MBL fold metallo-hydrolase [Prevotella sp.]
MLNIKTFVCNMLQENCYVVSDESHECVIIDCGVYYPEEQAALVSYISEAGLRPVHLIATHGHLDHNFGNALIYREFGLKLEIHDNDRDLIEHSDQQSEIFYQLTMDEAMPPIGRLLSADDTISFGSHKLTIIETPGHSRGCVCFYCEDEHVLFTGDTLFRHSVGRTDLSGGSMFMLIQSLRTLSQLPDNTQVFAGHGPQTTIGEEIARNPFLDR